MERAPRRVSVFLPESISTVATSQLLMTSGESQSTVLYCTVLYSWWYNWRVTPNHDKTPPEDFCTCSSGNCGPAPAGKTFVPMVTGYSEEDRPWMDDINDPVDDQYDVILGFNEPNRPDHADLPPEVAASAWVELQNLYPNKVSEEEREEIIITTPDPGQPSSSCRKHQLV